MFPTGQSPFPPMGGMFPGFQQAAAPAPQGIMKFIAPFLNRGAAGAAGSGMGIPGMGGPGFGAAGYGAQALGASQAAGSGGAGWLGHMQTALKAVQTAAPMVQQYGPMVKNIPAMINMMKLMNSSDDEETEEDTKAKGKKRQDESIDFEESVEAENSSVKRRQGTSQPKLYI